jgi:hypothetical protein
MKIANAASVAWLFAISGAIRASATTRDQAELLESDSEFWQRFTLSEESSMSVAPRPHVRLPTKSPISTLCIAIRFFCFCLFVQSVSSVMIIAMTLLTIYCSFIYSAAYR